MEKPRRILIVAGTLLFAAIAVFGISIFKHNADGGNVGSNKASAAIPADINNDNIVNILDLSIPQSQIVNSMWCPKVYCCKSLKLTVSCRLT
jgi:hypothetical protein